MLILTHGHCQDERVEASDIVTATLENTGWGPTKIATQIKMSYDQSFGAAWQVGHGTHMQETQLVLTSPLNVALLTFSVLTRRLSLARASV